MPTGLGATYLWSQMETSRHRWRPLQLNGSACTSSHISYQIMLVLWSCRWWISTDSFREMRSSTVGGFEDMAIDMEESGLLVLIQLVTNSREYSCWNLPENQDFDYTYVSHNTRLWSPCMQMFSHHAQVPHVRGGLFIQWLPYTLVHLSFEAYSVPVACCWQCIAALYYLILAWC